MKIILTSLLFILSIGVFGQVPAQSGVFLTHKNNPINPGDFLSIHDFKDIKIEKNVDTTEYEIQFVVVPFEGTLLSFSKKEHEVETIDIDYILSVGSITEDKIKHVLLYVRKNELTPPKFSGHVFTRKLESAEDYFNEFTQYARIGDKESSIWCIHQAIALDSTNLKHLKAQASFFYEIGELEASKNAFLNISTLDPDFTSYSHLTTISLQQGDYLNAKSYGQSSLKYSSNNLEKSISYLNIGDAEAKLLNFKSAYNYYKKAIDSNPKNVNALNNITTVLDEVNRSDEKVNYFQQILIVDSSFYLVHINIGFHYLNEEKFHLALAEFNSVLEIEPNQAIALSNQAYTLLKLGRLDEALISINRSIQLEPNNSYAFRNKALILMDLNNSKAACDALTEAIRLNFTQQFGEEVLLLKKKYCE